MEPDLYSRWSVATTSIYYTYYFCNVKNFFKLNFLFSDSPKSFLHIHRFQGFLRPDIIHIHWTFPIFHLCNIYEIHNVLNLLFLFLFQLVLCLFHKIFNSNVLVCMHKNSYRIRTISEKIISTAIHHDASRITNNLLDNPERHIIRTYILTHCNRI